MSKIKYKLEYYDKNKYYEDLNEKRTDTEHEHQFQHLFEITSNSIFLYVNVNCILHFKQPTFFKYFYGYFFLEKEKKILSFQQSLAHNKRKAHRRKPQISEG